jgi:hypothetical protein
VISQWYSALLRAGWSGVRVPAGAGNFSLHHLVQAGSGPHPASYQKGTRGCFPGVNRTDREADHSLPSSVKIKNGRSYTSTAPVRLHGVVLSLRKWTYLTLKTTTKSFIVLNIRTILLGCSNEGGWDRVARIQNMRNIYKILDWRRGRERTFARHS